MGQQAETALASMLANQGRGFQGWREGNIPPAPPLPPNPPGSRIPNPGQPGDPGGAPPGTHPSGEGGGGGDTGPGAGGVDHGFWPSQDVYGHKFSTRAPQAWIPSQATPFLKAYYGKHKFGSDPGNMLIRGARSGNLVFNPNDPTQYQFSSAFRSPGTYDRSGHLIPGAPVDTNAPGFWKSFSQFDQQAQPIQHALSAIEERWNARRARRKK